MARLIATLTGALFVLVVFSAGALYAQPPGFSRGPLITEYGPVTKIENAAPISADVTFNVAFDVTERGEIGSINRRFESAARFLNMHALAGVEANRMNLAVVVHGAAVKDLTHDVAYGGENANADLIKVLQAHGVKVYVCGQSAAFQGVVASELLPDVEMAVSAMTAHALLQQAGYTLNPF
ncbi:DsrE family protein [Kordiimonas aquimaris]|uniref:DsrE family protein n=1 Tax=Kordiimonas aquimaris TaxID=707591 RepID=UPI0021CF6F0B|nr:DsrE family protein [Kordiimonas aquimaris]